MNRRPSWFVRCCSGDLSVCRTGCLTACVTVWLLLAGTAVNAQALKPGLWEYTSTIKSSDEALNQAMAQMQKELANMPAAQRKQMEAMMGAQGVGLSGAKPNTVRLCLTPEQAAKPEMPSRDGCSQQSVERSGKTVRFKFNCQGPPPSSGEGQYTMDSDQAHRGKMVITSVDKGKPQRIEIDSNARWVSTDCGAIKPQR